jgi:hypothetical protein
MERCSSSSLWLCWLMYHEFPMFCVRAFLNFFFIENVLQLCMSRAVYIFSITPAELREILSTDSRDMPVLSSAVASHCYNCCTDGSTSPGNHVSECYITSLIKFILVWFLMTANWAHSLFKFQDISQYCHMKARRDNWWWTRHSK